MLAKREFRAMFAAMSQITRLLGALATGVFATNASAEPIEDGAAVPVVSQKNQDDQVIKLNEAGASGYLLVYFYPKSDTPGCTKQACSLRDSFAKLTEKGVKVYGVSTDKVKAQKAFGVPKTMGFAKRQAFLFKDGKLVWRDLTASTDEQAADVLKVVEGKG
jgi:thioredoxin-dependent peroxiredoxin